MLGAVGAAGFHATNVLLHALAAVTLWAAAPALFRLPRARSGLRLALALSFAVHPLSWQPAGLISYRPEVLLVLGVATCVAALGRWLATGSLGAALLAVVAAALALGSKETALVWLPGLAAPALLGGWGIGGWGVEAGRDGPGSEAPGRARLAILVGGGLLLAWLGLRFALVPAGWATAREPLPLMSAVATHLAVVGHRLPDLLGLGLPALSDRVVVVGAEAGAPA